MARKMLKPNARIASVFAILFFFMLVFLPVIKCAGSVDASKKVCALYSLCYTDYYVSVARMISMWGQWGTVCPDSNTGPIVAVIYLIGLLVLSYLVSAVIVHYYQKYRDI
jgi:hypothetical protein